MKIFAVAVLALLSQATLAEGLHGIEIFDSLGVIRSKYPNASVTPVNAAWVQKNQAFYRLKGSGFPGVLMLAFTDGRPKYRAEAATLGMRPSGDLSQQERAHLQVVNQLASEPDDEALTIEWMRWVPEESIPMSRFKAKYGEPRCGFTDDTLEPYCAWAERGLTAKVNESKTMVHALEATFTMRDVTKRFGAPRAASAPTASTAQPNTSLK